MPPQPTMWERMRSGSKTGFDKAFSAVDKIGTPVNKLSNKLGSEAFWPTTLDKESDKAARILKSFCKDGFYAEDEIQPVDGPKRKQRVIQKIPQKMIQRAKGLAIFTTMRTGLWFSGAGGSGVLLARMPDGNWSPPSGILLHTAGLGFLVGVDIYDCVVVINTEEALEAFTKIRCTLGSEISVAAGPVGAGGVLETEIHKRQAPIYTYLKSRGFYAGVQIDGTVIIERTDENARFYGERIPVKQILQGKVRHPPYELRRLMETIKAAQGDMDADETMIPNEAPPGDMEIEGGHTFGVPDQDDPDPYGVLALEKEGMSLKEAGSKKRASWEEFSFNPSPTSPVHSMTARQADMYRRSLSKRSSWRGSTWTNDSKSPTMLRSSAEQVRPVTIMSNASTQTDVSDDDVPPMSPDLRRSGHSRRGSRGSVADTLSQSHMQDVPEDTVLETSPERKEPASASRANGYTTPPRTPPADAHLPEDGGRAAAAPTADADADADADAAGVDEDDGKDEEDEDEEPRIEEPTMRSIQTVRTAQSIHAVQPTSPSVVTKARIVNVPKRVPPKLPPRNPNRSTPSLTDAALSSKEEIAAVSPGSTVLTLESHEDAGAEPVDPIEHMMKQVQLDESQEQGIVADPAAQTPDVHHGESGNNTKMPGGFD